MSEASTTILFLGLARDCEATVGIFAAYLRTLRSLGISCRALVGENGSRDHTRAVLLQNSDLITLVDTDFMVDGLPRLSRMAQGREAILMAAKSLDDAPRYICVADLDNVIVAPPAPSAIMAAVKTLSERETIFAISATSAPYYYDLLAFRAPNFDFVGLSMALAQAKKNPLTYYMFHKDSIYQFQKALTVDHHIECESAFNGLCLYRSQDYFRGTYRSQHEAEICEHVTFNRSVATDHAPLMIVDPAMVLRTPSDHSPSSFWDFWRNRLCKLLALRCGASSTDPILPAAA